MPDTVEVKNKTMKIVDYHVPKGSPYAVLETYSNSDAKTRIIHVLNFGGTEFITIGRCRESNIKVADNSVSRMHSKLIYYRGKFYQSDLASKFGTLRIIRKPIKVQNTVTIQSGNTVLSFSLLDEVDS